MGNKMKYKQDSKGDDIHVIWYDSYEETKNWSPPKIQLTEANWVDEVDDMRGKATLPSVKF